jgi:hypothetical protein
MERRATFDVIRRAFESAGVEFIDENGGAPGCDYRSDSEERITDLASRTGPRGNVAGCWAHSRDYAPTKFV